MATFIIFREGVEAHIKDVLVGGQSCYFFVEKRRLYHRETIAVRRAFVYCRKKANVPLRRKRHRRKIKEVVMVLKPITIPTICKIVIDGKQKYKVVETGKVFVRESTAIKNALTYAREKNKR